jgi:hypothetical protein
MTSGVFTVVRWRNRYTVVGRKERRWVFCSHLRRLRERLSYPGRNPHDHPLDSICDWIARYIAQPGKLSARFRCVAGSFPHALSRVSCGASYSLLDCVKIFTFARLLGPCCSSYFYHPNPTLILVTFHSVGGSRVGYQKRKRRAHGNTMTSTFLLTLALLAPTMAYAAAFPPTIPGPTHFLVTVDSWSPAPTAAPHLPFDLFRRQQQPQGSNTCGFVSGNSGQYFSPSHHCKDPEFMSVTVNWPSY